MSVLKNYRRAIKATLVAANVLPAKQIIIDRQADEWEVIGQAIEMAENGLCLHIAEASGTNTDPDSDEILAEVNIVLTIFCEPVYHPTADDDYDSTSADPVVDTWPEEELWEAMVRTLHGKFIEAAGSTLINHCRYWLRMLSWSHVPNEFDYYARATTFKFTLYLPTT